MNRVLQAAIVSLGLIGGGCRDKDIDVPGSPARGIVSGAITDAPVDALASVVLRMERLELRLDGEEDLLRIDLRNSDDSPREVDLLEYRNGDTFPLFRNLALPAGTYTHAKLVLEAPAPTGAACRGQDPLAGTHVVTAEGALVPVYVPRDGAGPSTLDTPFEVKDGDDMDIVVDLDLRRSLYPGESRDCYHLRPALRVAVPERSGRVEGTVDSLLMDGSTGLCSDPDPATGNSLYVYAGADRTPDDLDDLTGDGTAPFTSAAVDYDPGAGNTGGGRFMIAYLPPGDYTVAFTCRADAERLPDPDSDDQDARLADDALGFQGTRTVTVAAGNTARIALGGD